MNDKDVIRSRGKKSLKRLHANALALLDLTYTKDDLTLLVEDARHGLDQKSIAQIRETLDIFLELLDFQPVPLGVLEQNLQIFAGPKLNGAAVPVFEYLILFEEETLSLVLKNGPFSPQSDLDFPWVKKYVRSEKPSDLKGIDVFEFLAERALEKANGIMADNQMD